MIDIKVLLQQTLGGSLSLIAVTITLLAILPVVISIIKTRNDNIIISNDIYQTVKKQLARIYKCLYLFGISSLASFVGIFYTSASCMIIASFAFAVGLFILVIACVRISALTLTLLSED